MAAGDPLPEDDRVTRGCVRGYANGEITFSAFEMRDNEKPLKRISVDWVECRYVSKGEQNVKGSVKRMKMNPFVHPPYAVLKVADIRLVERGSYRLDAKEYGSRRKPCHCAITGFSGTPVDLEIQHELAKIANRSSVIEAPK